MTELEQCKSVLADLEKAGGADPRLDHAISEIFSHLNSDGLPTGFLQQFRVVWQKTPWTASLDATIALVERVLPGWEWIRKSPGTMTVYDPDIPEKTWAVHYDARGATPPLALLTALFRAKIAQMEKADG